MDGPGHPLKQTAAEAADVPGSYKALKRRRLNDPEPENVIAAGRHPHPISTAAIAACSLQADDRFRDMGVPGPFQPPNCVYCLLIGVDPVNGRRVFTFGMAKDVKERVETHRKVFRHAKVALLASLGEFSAAPVEDTIRDCDLVRARAAQVTTLGNERRRDCFSCTAEETESVIMGIAAAIQHQHGHKLSSLWVQGQQQQQQQQQQQLRRVDVQQMVTALRSLQAECTRMLAAMEPWIDRPVAP